MMQLFLHDTMRREKVPFEPLLPDRIRMYVCGPTVYDVPHIGNARPAIVFDLLYRLLQHLHPERHVVYARNYTDIDDKIINRAAERGVSTFEVSVDAIMHYEAAMAALNVLHPTLKPRATDNMPAMIQMISRLIVLGHAYEVEEHVLFDVRSNPRHGILSGQTLEGLEAGARVEIAPYKRSPEDFILWKPSAQDQPGWVSPWGIGRPGWHIECSAMIAEHLASRESPTIDIHGGGSDLIFPHHENEIAQSDCHWGVSGNYTGLARYWVHNGMLLSGGKKMAKSAGNFVTVPDVLKTQPAEALRLLFLQTHYRQPLDFTWERLAEARGIMDRFYRAIEQVQDTEWNSPEEQQRECVPPAMLVEKLCDDMNTPEALVVLHRIADHALNARNYRERRRLAGNLIGAGTLLGLFRSTADSWFGRLADTEVDDLIARRNRHREQQQWQEADTIREQLAGRGILLEDKGGETRWRRA